MLELIGADADGAGHAPSRDPVEIRVLDALGRRPRSTVQIAKASGLSLDEVRSALGLLALGGAAEQHDGGWRRP